MDTYLLLDIGNSNIKAGISAKSGVTKIDNFKYYGNDINRLTKLISGRTNNPPNLIGVSTNNKIIKKELQQFLEKNRYKYVFVSRTIKLPLRLKYAKSLGADRISGAAGAYCTYKRNKNILFIDFGTATTLNLISDNTFLGGMIAPGVLTLLKSLSENTTLPAVSFKAKSELIYHDTESNIQAGTYHQTLFFIDETIAAIRKKYKSLLVISTGGFGELFKEKLNSIDVYDENLILKGINFILGYNDIK